MGTTSPGGLEGCDGLPLLDGGDLPAWSAEGVVCVVGGLTRRVEVGLEGHAGDLHPDRLGEGLSPQGFQRHHTAALGKLRPFLAQ